MTAARRVTGLLVLAALSLGLPALGCSRAEPPRETVATTVPRDAGAARPHVVGQELPPPPLVASAGMEGTMMAFGSRIPCRAIAVTGDVRRETGATAGDAAAPALAVGDQLPEPALVALGNDARLTVKDARTGRETALEGPARGRLCVDAENESWIATGTFRASPGAGEALGNEVFVGTPYAAFRYGSATLRATVGAALELEVTAGSVLVRPAAGARLRANAADAGESAGWVRVPAGSTAVIEPRPGAGNPLPREVAACKAAAEETHQRVKELNAFDSGDLPEHAVAHVEARQRAHAACAIAHANALKHDPSGARRDVAEALAKADALWGSIGEPLTEGH